MKVCSNKELSVLQAYEFDEQISRKEWEITDSRSKCIWNLVYEKGITSMRKEEII